MSVFADKLEFSAAPAKGYTVNWSDTSTFADRGEGVCTHSMNYWRLRRGLRELYSRPVQAGGVLIDTRAWTLQHQQYTAGVAEDGAWWRTMWHNREATAELENLILLYPSRHSHLFEQYYGDVLLCMRHDEMLNTGYGTPFRNGLCFAFPGVRHPPMYCVFGNKNLIDAFTGVEFGFLGFAVWYALSQAGFKFPDVACKERAMPYAGLAVGVGLRACLPEKVLYRCLRLADEWAFDPGSIDARGMLAYGRRTITQTTTGADLMQRIVRLVRRAKVDFNQQRETITVKNLYPDQNGANIPKIDWSVYKKQYRANPKAKQAAA